MVEQVGGECSAGPCGCDLTWSWLRVLFPAHLSKLYLCSLSAASHVQADVCNPSRMLRLVARCVQDDLACVVRFHLEVAIKANLKP